MAKKSIVDSDPDDSGARLPAYSKQPSREYTAEELHEMERRARKEGKRDILLSQLVDQQVVTTQALADITTRLATGSQDINIIKEHQAKLESESGARLQAIGRISAQAQQATTLIKTHIDQCNERKQNEDKRNAEEDKRWAAVQKSLDESTKRHGRNPALEKETIWDKIGVNVISAVIIAAMMGGLCAYFFIFKGEGNAIQNDSHARDDNQNQPAHSEK